MRSLGTTSTFFFEATSNSMEPLIFERDVLVVDRSIENYDKKVAVIALNGELICKRIIKNSKNVILRSKNSAYADVKVTEEMDMIIFGVVVAIARELY